MTETSIAFLGKKISENAVFVGSGFLALGGGSLDETNAKSIHLYTRKSSKKSHTLTEEVWSFSFVPICLILRPFYFNLFLLHFFGQAKLRFT